MIRSAVLVLILVVAGLFGWFYVRSDSTQDSGRRARDAAGEIGDVVMDKGMAGLVHARLVTKLGYESAAFLHVYHDDGRVIVYGLLPETVDPQVVIEEVSSTPGVKAVELLVQPRPAGMVSVISRPAAGEPGGEGGGERSP